MSFIGNTIRDARSGSSTVVTFDTLFAYSRGNRDLITEEVIQLLNELGEITAMDSIQIITDPTSTLSGKIAAYRFLYSRLRDRFSDVELEYVLVILAFGITSKASQSLRVHNEFVDSNIINSPIIKAMLKSALNELDNKLSNEGTYGQALDTLEAVLFLSDYEYSLDPSLRSKILQHLTETTEKALLLGKAEYTELSTTWDSYSTFTAEYRVPVKNAIIAVINKDKESASKALKEFEDAVHATTSYSVIDEVVFDSGLYKNIN